MEILTKYLAIAVLSYLAGAIPTAVIISKLFFGFDIREKGSGNMGSTNAFRILGWKWGMTVQVIDIAKGMLAVMVIAPYFGSGIPVPNATSFEDLTLIKIGAGIVAVCGHIWSVFVSFKGGKGVNTAAGMLIGLVPVDVGIAFGLFVVAVIFSGYISLGSIIAAFTLPTSLLVRYNIFHDNIPGYQILIYFSIAVSLLIIFTHRANIKRLLKGTENRFAKLQLIKLKLMKKSNNSDS